MNSRINKEIFILPVSFAVGLSLNVMYLAIVFFLKAQHSAGAAQVGMIAGIYAVAYTVGCLLVQPIAHKLKPTVSLPLACFGMGLACVLTLYGKSLVISAVGHTSFGLLTCFFWPVLMGWLSQGQEGKNLGKAMTRFNMSWSFGAVVGPFLAGWLATCSARLPLIVTIFVLFISGVVIAVGTKLTWVPQQTQELEEAPEGKETSLRFPAWLGLFCTFFILGVITNTWSYFAESELELSRNLIGRLIGLRAIATAAGFVLLGRFTFWHFNFKVLLGGTGISLFLCLLFTVSNNTIITAILLVVFGVMMSLAYVMSFFHGVSGAENRAGRMAIHESLLSVGITVGATCAGFILESLGYRQVWYTATGLMILCLILQIPLRKIKAGER